MKCRIRRGMLIVELPLIFPARKSKSGKTLLVASSNGPKRTSLKVDEKPVVVIVNAYVRPDEYVKRAETSRRKKARGHRQSRQRSKPKVRLGL
jgi:hypothetical protein